VRYQNDVVLLRGGRFAIEAELPPGSGLLIDDFRFSGWTLAMVGGQLRKRGAAAIYPFTLATAFNPIVKSLRARLPPSSTSGRGVITATGSPSLPRTTESPQLRSRRRCVRGRRPPEPFVFFVDECLGASKVTEALAQAVDVNAGESVRAPDTATLDEDWLPAAGREGWLCISKRACNLLGRSL